MRSPFKITFDLERWAEPRCDAGVRRAGANGRAPPGGAHGAPHQTGETKARKVK
jgi:hypothetical protein